MTEERRGARGPAGRHSCVSSDCSPLSLSDGSATPTCHRQPPVTSPVPGAQRVSLRRWSGYSPGQLGYRCWAPRRYQCLCGGEQESRKKTGEEEGQGRHVDSRSAPSDPLLMRAGVQFIISFFFLSLRMNCWRTEFCAKLGKKMFQRKTFSRSALNT